MTPKLMILSLGPGTLVHTHLVPVLSRYLEILGHAVAVRSTRYNSVQVIIFMHLPWARIYNTVYACFQRSAVVEGRIIFVEA